VNRIAALAMKRGKSVDFTGDWQRHVTGRRKWSPGLAELMFLVSTPELKANLIPIIAAPLRRSSVTESVALPPNNRERNLRPSSARAVRTARRS
jgi:hypothetical protein